MLKLFTTKVKNVKPVTPSVFDNPSESWKNWKWVNGTESFCTKKSVFFGRVTWFIKDVNGKCYSFKATNKLTPVDLENALTNINIYNFVTK